MNVGLVRLQIEAVANDILQSTEESHRESNLTLPIWVVAPVHSQLVRFQPDISDYQIILHLYYLPWEHWGILYGDAGNPR